VPRTARPPLGYALTMAAGGFFAVNGTVSTLALQAGIPATRLTALRCTGAAVVLLVVLALLAPARLRVSWREVPFLAVFGVVGVALTQFLYYVAIGRMPVGIALVFEMTAPVFIALYVWLVRRERVRSRLWLALLLSLSGLVLVAEVWEDGGSLDPVGVGAALLAALCLATYYLMGERGTVTGPPSCRRALRRCSMLGLGGSRGDGLGRSLFEGQRDTAAPGSRGAVDRQQRDAPQSASQ
jgi:drug/metabolite transporter (DMT)-like permease